MTPHIHALLPCGSRLPPDFAQRTGTNIKALLRVRGRTLLQIALDALRESDVAKSVTVVGPRELLTHSVEADTFLLDGGAGASGPDNIFRAVESLPPDATHALVLTSDLPFVTGQALRDFVNDCPQRDACVSACRRETFEARFPNVGGEWVSLLDGSWTVGGAYLLSVPALRRARPHIERIFASRKSQFDMARLLGPDFIARFVTKRLSTDHILRRVESIVNVTGAKVLCAPELAFDIDTLGEFDHAARLS